MESRFRKTAITIVLVFVILISLIVVGCNNGSFDPKQLNVEGIKGVENINIDHDNKTISFSVDVDENFSYDVEFKNEEILNYDFYYDQECQQVVDRSVFKLEAGENVLYLKVVFKESLDTFIVYKIIITRNVKDMADEEIVWEEFVSPTPTKLDYDEVYAYIEPFLISYVMCDLSIDEDKATVIVRSDKRYRQNVETAVDMYLEPMGITIEEVASLSAIAKKPYDFGFVNMYISGNISIEEAFSNVDQMQGFLNAVEAASVIADSNRLAVLASIIFDQWYTLDLEYKSREYYPIGELTYDKVKELFENNNAENKAAWEEWESNSSRLNQKAIEMFISKESISVLNAFINGIREISEYDAKEICTAAGTVISFLEVMGELDSFFNNQTDVSVADAAKAVNTAAKIMGEFLKGCKNSPGFSVATPIIIKTLLGDEDKIAKIASNESVVSYVEFVIDVLDNVTAEEAVSIYLDIDDLNKADENEKLTKTGCLIVDVCNIIKEELALLSEKDKYAVFQALAIGFSDGSVASCEEIKGIYDLIISKTSASFTDSEFASIGQTWDNLIAKQGKVEESQYEEIESICSGFYRAYLPIGATEEEIIAIIDGLVDKDLFATGKARILANYDVSKVCKTEIQIVIDETYITKIDGYVYDKNDKDRFFLYINKFNNEIPIYELNGSNILGDQDFSYLLLDKYSILDTWDGWSFSQGTNFYNRSYQAIIDTSSTGLKCGYIDYTFYNFEYKIPYLYYVKGEEPTATSIGVLDAYYHGNYGKAGFTVLKDATIEDLALTITVTYDMGYSSGRYLYESEYTITGFDSTTTGKKTLTISALGLETSIDYYVVEAKDVLYPEITLNSYQPNQSIVWGETVEVISQWNNANGASGANITIDKDTSLDEVLTMGVNIKGYYENNKIMIQANAISISELGALVEKFGYELECDFDFSKLDEEKTTELKLTKEGEEDKVLYTITYTVVIPTVDWSASDIIKNAFNNSQSIFDAVINAGSTLAFDIGFNVLGTESSVKGLLKKDSMEWLLNSGSGIYNGYVNGVAYFPVGLATGDATTIAIEDEAFSYMPVTLASQASTTLSNLEPIMQMLEMLINVATISEEAIMKDANTVKGTVVLNLGVLAQLGAAGPISFLSQFLSHYEIDWDAAAIIIASQMGVGKFTLAELDAALCQGKAALTIIYNSNTNEMNELKIKIYDYEGEPCTFGIKMNRFELGESMSFDAPQIEPQDYVQTNEFVIGDNTFKNQLIYSFGGTGAKVGGSITINDVTFCNYNYLGDEILVDFTPAFDSLDLDATGYETTIFRIDNALFRLDDVVDLHKHEVTELWQYAFKDYFFIYNLILLSGEHWNTSFSAIGDIYSKKLDSFIDLINAQGTTPGLFNILLSSYTGGMSESDFTDLLYSLLTTLFREEGYLRAFGAIIGIDFSEFLSGAQMQMVTGEEDYNVRIDFGNSTIYASQASTIVDKGEYENPTINDHGASAMFGGEIGEAYLTEDALSIIMYLLENILGE